MYKLSLILLLILSSVSYGEETYLFDIGYKFESQEARQYIVIAREYSFGSPVYLIEETDFGYRVLNAPQQVIPEQNISGYYDYEEKGVRDKINYASGTERVAEIAARTKKKPQGKKRQSQVELTEKEETVAAEVLLPKEPTPPELPEESPLKIDQDVLYISKDQNSIFPVVIKKFLVGPNGDEQILVARQDDHTSGFLTTKQYLVQTDMVNIKPTKKFRFEIGEKVVTNHDRYQFTIKDRVTIWNNNFYLIPRAENGQTWDQVMSEGDFASWSNLSLYE